MKIERFEDLDCWKQARLLVFSTFLLCREGELSRDWETRGQLKRAALSTMNNIAEGFGRFHQRDKLRFYDIAKSSALEVKSMIYALEDLRYLTPETAQKFHQQCDATIRSTAGLIRYLLKAYPDLQS